MKAARPLKYKAILGYTNNPVIDLLAVRIRSLEKSPICVKQDSFAAEGMRILFFQQGKAVSPNRGGSYAILDLKGDNFIWGVDIITDEERTFFIDTSTVSLKPVKTIIKTNFDIYRCSDLFDPSIALTPTPVRETFVADLAKRPLPPPYQADTEPFVDPRPPS